MTTQAGLEESRVELPVNELSVARSLQDSDLQNADRSSNFLASLRRKGVKLWSAEGQLHYRAPKGLLTHDEIAVLRAARSEIVSLLEKADALHPVQGPRRSERHAGLVPLSFSQLAHWSLYELWEKPAYRNIACATRLRGPLDIGALRKSVDELIRRHEALRTRIVLRDGVPMQEVVTSGSGNFEIVDLIALPRAIAGVALSKGLEQMVSMPIGICVDPLFEFKLFRLGPDNHVLGLAMEHIVSDEYSLQMLLRELFVAYTQAVRGRPLSLPEVRAQITDYCAWQRSSHRSWIATHWTYWQKHLEGCGRVRFPADFRASSEVCSRWGSVSLRVESDLKQRLDAWCRQRRTTLVMGVFTAYVALVLRWCDATDSVVQFQSDGRFVANIENTVGYLAAVLYIRARLFDGDNFTDLLTRLTREYCNAHEHADLCFIESQTPRPGLTRNTIFNWIPRGRIDLSELKDFEHALQCSPVSIPRPLKNLRRDNEPMAILVDTDNEIVGDLLFRIDRLSQSTMERFARSFVMFLRTLVEQPEMRVQDIRLAE